MATAYDLKLDRLAVELDGADFLKTPVSTKIFVEKRTRREKECKAAARTKSTPMVEM